jgi:hypothetical protein
MSRRFYLLTQHLNSQIVSDRFLDFLRISLMSATILIDKIITDSRKNYDSI